MSQYERGAVLERAARKVLEDSGYFVVRSGGSKTPVDLVALKRGETVLVQCKLDGYLLPAERVALRKLAIELGAVPLVARWHKPLMRSPRQVQFAKLLGSAVGTAGTGTVPWSPDRGLEAAE